MDVVDCRQLFDLWRLWNEVCHLNRVKEIDNVVQDGGAHGLFNASSKKMSDFRIRSSDFECVV